MSAYRTFSVVKTDRRTRRVLATLATGLSMNEAGDLQRRLLRERAPEDEGRFTFGVSLAPLAVQATILAPAPLAAAA